MIRKQFEKIKSGLEAISSSKGEGALLFIKNRLSTLNRILKTKDPLEGDISYYSLDAEHKIKENIEILEKNVKGLNILMAALITIQKVKNNISQLESETPISEENKGRIEEAKEVIRKINVAPTSKVIEEIPEVKEILENDLNEESYLEAPPGVEKLRKVISSLESTIKSTKSKQEKLPKGMLDIKRGLSILSHQKKIKEMLDTERAKDPAEKSEEKILKYEEEYQSARFCTEGSDDSEKLIRERLSELQALMASTRTHYQRLENMGGGKDLFLHKTTAFYWESVHVYRLALLAFKNDFNEISEKQILSETGQLIGECIKKAVIDLPGKRRILTGLEAVKTIDADFENFSTGYSVKGKPSLKYYNPKAFEMIEAQTGADGKFFYFPYSDNKYALDHPAKTDYADSAGNCHGESLMFIQQMGFKQHISNICPETELIEYQLDQTKEIRGTKPKKIGETLLKEGDDKIELKDVLSLVSQPVVDKYGDLCQLKLGGLDLGEGHITGHAIGLLRVKNPSPYKYILYDYNLGALGLESDVDLKKYFDKALSGFKPFKTAKLVKHDAMSFKCAEFISSITSLNNDKYQETKVVRQRWPAQQILMLAKYGNLDEPGSVIEVLNELDKFPVKKRSGIYQALKDNKNINIKDLLLMYEFKDDEIIKEILKAFKEVLMNEESESIISHAKIDDIKKESLRSLLKQSIEGLTRQSEQNDNTLENKAKDFAATKVQTNFRGYKAREATKPKLEEARVNEAATKIQAGARGMLGRSKAKEVRQEQAATKIQAGRRGKLGRAIAKEAKEREDMAAEDNRPLIEQKLPPALRSEEASRENQKALNKWEGKKPGSKLSPLATYLALSATADHLEVLSHLTKENEVALLNLYNKGKGEEVCKEVLTLELSEEMKLGSDNKTLNLCVKLNCYTQSRKASQGEDTAAGTRNDYLGNLSFFSAYVFGDTHRSGSCKISASKKASHLLSGSEDTKYKLTTDEIKALSEGRLSRCLDKKAINEIIGKSNSLSSENSLGNQ